MADRGVGTAGRRAGRFAEKAHAGAGAAAVAVCGAAALAAVRGVREVWAFLEDLLAAVEISSTLFLPLLKTAGIAVVTRIGADLCRDAGESAVASAVEMAGAMGALLAVLPLMQAAWEVLRSLLYGRCG